MFEKVLVPLDGSEMAEGILPFVSVLAKGSQTELVLLAVVDPHAAELPERMLEGVGESVGATQVTPGAPPPTDVGRYEPGSVHGTGGGPYASQLLESQLLERSETQAIGTLGKVVERLKREGIDARSAVRFGEAAEEIVGTAEREGCDLIAMSTHGRSALGRGVLGSVMDKVIHSSGVPTLTITPERAATYWEHGVRLSKIMVPLDGSTLAEQALPYAKELARRLSAEVVLVRAIKMSGLYYGAYMEGFRYMPEIEKGIEDDGREYLEDVAKELREEGLTVTWKLVRGSAAGAVTQLARETPQDLVVMTTHGRSGLTRWVVGSVAEALVRSSGDPVLVIPPARADE